MFIGSFCTTNKHLSYFRFSKREHSTYIWHSHYRFKWKNFELNRLRVDTLLIIKIKKRKKMFVYLFSNNNKRIFRSFDIRKRFTARHSDFKWRNFELSRPCVHVILPVRNKENVGFSLVRYPWIIVIKRSFKWNNFELLIGHVQTRNFLKIRRVKKKKIRFSYHFFVSRAQFRVPWNFPDEADRFACTLSRVSRAKRYRALCAARASVTFQRSSIFNTHDPPP